MIQLKGLIAGAVLILLVLWVPAERGIQAGSLYALENPGGPAPIDDRVLQSMAALPAGEMLTVIVTLRDQARTDLLPAAPDRAAAQVQMVTALRSRAQGSQARILKLLADRRQTGSAAEIIPFWIFNGLAVTAAPDVIRELAALPEVASITPNAEFRAPVVEPADLSAPLENLSLVNAPALWIKGYRGEGVVVANMDTGVDGSHPDLAAQWRGGNKSWFDATRQFPASPVDPPNLLGSGGHGTATMGVMLGSGLNGTTTGLAPNAHWIAVRIFNTSGSTTTTIIHLAFQWLLDPDGNPLSADAPHVVNLSWGVTSPGCFTDFQTDLQNLRAAGILPVVSAGNSGPGLGTGTSPAVLNEALSVGAVDKNKVLYDQSSKGPSMCSGFTGAFPRLVAPGVSITSTTPGGLYKPLTGTSLSAPHVAGGLALLLSAYPDLPIADQQHALVSTAIDLGVSGPDDLYGNGLLDVLAAYNLLSMTYTPNQRYRYILSPIYYNYSFLP